MQPKEKDYSKTLFYCQSTVEEDYVISINCGFVDDLVRIKGVHEEYKKFSIAFGEFRLYPYLILSRISYDKYKFKYFKFNEYQFLDFMPSPDAIKNKTK